MRGKVSRLALVLVAVLVTGGVVLVLVNSWRFLPASSVHDEPVVHYQPRKALEPGGFFTLAAGVRPWPASASLDRISDSWHRAGQQQIEGLTRSLAQPGLNSEQKVQGLLTKATLLNAEGDPIQAYQNCVQARALTEDNEALAQQWLFTIVYFQGVTALRRAENENCIACRGESSCILPISPAAVHTNPAGSRLAIEHFTEYLRQFPDDLEIRWLLNVAHMTLAEHPHKVEPRFLLSLDRYNRSEFDIGRFRDIVALVGVNRFNQSGGAIMDDFDNDGLLDIVVTTLDPTQHMALYRNRGDGTFEDRAKEAGLTGQLGGLYCVQADFDNDGHMDIFICRGAWVHLPMRPSLLRNNGDGTFTDVTEKSGLLEAVNSNSACWADYDNDGHVDLFVCCERQPNRLYRNKGDGTFEEVAAQAGMQGNGTMCKGACWIDFDNDGYPDLFINNYLGPAQLFRNNRDGTFTDVTRQMGIDGPQKGFSCWAFDFDNDGWLDLFATSYDRTLEDVVKGLMGQPHGSQPNKLFRNLQGKGFKDVTKEAGLDVVLSAMGSNFGDLDNDGWLDMYLGTGEPSFATLVPNRMFRNVAGRRFAEITASSGTGHLQKGHAVACGDWDRNGTLDVFIQMGGAVNGDRYHNILFQNPGQGNKWLSVKLVGKKTNRSAIGARIKVVTAGEKPLTVYRHVSSGSSFGANPLEQHIGLAKAERVARLEVHWPTSGTTQVFHDVAVNQWIEVTEFANDYRRLTRKAIPLPK
jgi:hypothetical protein